MSTVQTPASDPTTATTETPKGPEKKTIKRTFTGYDANLKKVSANYTVEFTPAATYEEATTRLNGDVNKLLAGANVILEKEAIKTEKDKAGITNGIDAAVFAEFAKPYRDLPNFASMISSTDKRKATAEEWDKQTEAIAELFRQIPQIMDALRARSAAADAE